MHLKSKLTTDTAILFYLAFLKSAIHLYVNAVGGYGLFRDEFYYLACADHPAWGYVDQPPLSILILTLWKFVFGDSLFSIRFLPAVIGGLVVFLTGKITAELGGKRFAQILAAIAVIVAPGFMALHSIYSMNVFDHLVWASLLYVLVKIFKTENSKLWLLFGLIAGLGLQNKISVLFLAFGLGIGMLLTRHRRWLADKFLWIGVAIAVTLFLPHVIWQIQHDWPTLEFMANASQFKNTRLSPIEFFIEQFANMNPAAIILWVPGLLYLLFSRRFKSYRIFAIAYLAIFTLFVVQHGKPYYLFPIYPVLFAAGAVFLETSSAKKYLVWLKPVTLSALVCMGLFSAPFALPLLPVNTYQNFAKKTGISPSSGENHQMGTLPQHFADMHGWEDMVAEIAQVYHSLPDAEKTVASIYVQNYGQAGAIDYYRDKYNLPPAICGHNNYFLWGRRGQTGEVLIIFGGTRAHHEQVYETVMEAARFEHPYVMPYENNQPIYICRGLKVPLAKVWPSTKHFG